MNMTCLKYRYLLPLLLLLSAAVVPAAPAAAKEPLVAAIIVGDLPRYREIHNAFVKILEAGNLSGVKAKVFVQTPNPDKMSLANSIRRAVAGGADLIVAYGAPAALAAQKEAGHTPVLFADVYDPVAEGLVKSLASPGGDLTGASSQAPPEGLLEALFGIRSCKKLGVLYPAGEKGGSRQFQEIEAWSKKRSCSIIGRSFQGAEEMVAAAEKLLGQEVDAVVLADGAASAVKGREVMELAAASKVPVASLAPGLGGQGALLTLEADPTEQGSLVAVHALQILAGQKAHILPVRTPKKVALVLNAKTAQQLGLEVPQEVAGRVDRVLQ